MGTRQAAVVLLAIGAGACGVARPARFEPAAAVVDPRAVVQRVALVGDAGTADNAARMRALGRLLARDGLAERTTLVFLGDNLYPTGPEIDARKTAILDAQLAAGAEVAKTLFIAGNHDWDDGAWRPSFDEALAKVDAASGHLARAATWVPAAGCPGPVSWEPPGARVKIVAIDSEWWFQDEAERERGARERGCAQPTAGAAVTAIAEELRCAPERPCPPRLVVAHHPLVTAGPHGGHFAWHEHLLCEGRVPLPLGCSIYVLLRRAGIARQDTASETYGRYVAAMTEATAADPPLVFAAGHEHNLQIHADRAGAQRLVVSGSAAKRSSLGWKPGMRFGSGEHGFVTVDVLEDGRVVLRVYALDVERLGWEPIYAERLR